jgi:uncharacterized RDD family membrane protein YckC
VSWAQLRDVVSEGLLRPSDPVWRAGQPDWVPAHTLEGLFPSPGTAAAPPPFTPHAAGERSRSAETDLGHLASPWLRLGGQLLDAIVVWAIILIAFGWAAFSDSDLHLSAGFALPVVMMYLLAVGYVLLADGLPGGQSLGKRVLKMTVIKERTGRPCSFVDSFVRNLLLAVLGPIDWLFIFGRKHQRLGDKAAGTLVLKIDG